MKLSGGLDTSASNLLQSLPDENLRPMVDALIEGMIGQRIPPERCDTIDQAVRLLAPLPAQSTAELIALAAGLGSKGGGARVGRFSLCAA